MHASQLLLREPDQYQAEVALQSFISENIEWQI